MMLFRLRMRVWTGMLCSIRYIISSFIPLSSTRLVRRSSVPRQPGSTLTESPAIRGDGYGMTMDSALNFRSAKVHGYIGPKRPQAECARILVVIARWRADGHEAPGLWVLS